MRFDGGAERFYAPEPPVEDEKFRMGAIRKTATLESQVLESEHFIGRVGPPKCSLTLREAEVSGVHALLRWTGAAWEVKDQGSRNGTFVDGARLENGKSREVQRGCRLAFGTEANEWEVVDDSAPAVMAVPLDGGEPRVLEDGLVALPSPEEPRFTIYRGTDGRWLLENGGSFETTALIHAQTFQAAGRLWRFCSPTQAAPTVENPRRLEFAVEAFSVRKMHLTLSVTQNQEYVEARVTQDGRELSLGTSVYLYLLVILARQRIQDATAGVRDSACGWVDYEGVADPIMESSAQLALGVHRVRKLFLKAGFGDGAQIIERRAGRLIRIGTSQVTVVTI